MDDTRKESRIDWLCTMFIIVFIYGFGIYGCCAYIFDFAVPPILWIPTAGGTLIFVIFILILILNILDYFWCLFLGAVPK